MSLPIPPPSSLTLLCSAPREDKKKKRDEDSTGGGGASTPKRGKAKNAGGIGLELIYTNTGGTPRAGHGCWQILTSPASSKVPF